MRDDPVQTAALVESGALLRHVETVNVIRTVDEYYQAATVLKQVKARLALLDAKKKTFTAPAREVIQNATDFFGPAEKDYAAIEARLKALIGTFVDARLPQAMLEAQAAVAAGDKNALMVAMRPLPSVEGLTFRTVMDFEVDEAEGEVPSTYYLPRELNAKLIRTQLRAGVVISGIRAVERTSVAVSIEEVK